MLYNLIPDTKSFKKNSYVTVTRVVGYGKNQTKEHMFGVRFPNNSRKPEAPGEGSLNKACLCFMLTMDRMTNAGTTPMDTYPNSSISLYLYVTTTEDIKTYHTSSHLLWNCFCFKQLPVFPVNTRGREFGFSLVSG